MESLISCNVGTVARPGDRNEPGKRHNHVCGGKATGADVIMLATDATLAASYLTSTDNE